VLSPITQTLDWHRAVREASPVQLTPLQRMNLARRLIREEVGELDYELASIVSLLAGEYGTDTDLKALKAKAAKEAADVLFVVLQAMDALEIPFETVYAAVVENNWVKLKDGPQFRNDGKLLKPAGYIAPDIEALL